MLEESNWILVSVSLAIKQEPESWSIEDVSILPSSLWSTNFFVFGISI